MEHSTTQGGRARAVYPQWAVVGTYRSSRTIARSTPPKVASTAVTLHAQLVNLYLHCVLCNRRQLLDACFSDPAQYAHQLPQDDNLC
jgi:hypothetical protein